jgi:hypothetical protein
MAEYTVKQISDAAEGACFYVTPNGQWLRMQYTEVSEGHFVAMDEESGEDYTFRFEDMVDEPVHFEHIVRTEFK